MKTYEFTVYINGSGDTPEEAWRDAVKNLQDEINNPPQSGYCLVDDEET